MDQTNAVEFTSKLKSWINPPHPGRNKSPVLALLMGFVLGPIGVALYLRSLAQGGLALVVGVLIALITGWSPEWIGTIVGAGWAVGRVLYDNQPPASPKPDTASRAPTSPMDHGPSQSTVAMA